MRPQVKPQPWLCLPTAFAIALDMPVAEFLRIIGHDGSQVVFPELQGISKYRGIHIAEATQAVLELGHTATPVERYLQTAPGTSNTTPDPSVKPFKIINTRWRKFLQIRGVLEGWGKACGHAVAFEHGLICDPDDGQLYYDLDTYSVVHNFTPWRLWIVK